MKIKNNFTLALNNLFRNKLNILLLVIITILDTVVLIGGSYYLSIRKFWTDWTKNSYDFNLLIATPSKDINKLIKDLKENEHIKDAFTYTEYYGYGVFDDYITDELNGEVDLFGTVSGTKKIIYGKDLDTEEDGMICPSNFVADSRIYHGKYSRDYIVDLKNLIGKDINIKYINQSDTKLKLIGIFDGAYDYSYPNACYVNHSTLKKLNNLYQPELTDGSRGIYILIDDWANVDVLNDYGIANYLPVKTIKTDVGDKTILITGISTFVLIAFIFNIAYFLYSRRIIRENRNIGILKMIGYSSSKIKKIYYIEVLILISIAYLLSTGISYFVCHNFVDWFLTNEVFLSLIKVNLNIYLLIATCFIDLIIMCLSIFISLKKIDKMEINEILYD